MTGARPTGLAASETSRYAGLGGPPQDHMGWGHREAKQSFSVSPLPCWLRAWDNHSRDPNKASVGTSGKEHSEIYVFG